MLCRNLALWAACAALLLSAKASLAQARPDANRSETSRANRSETNRFDTNRETRYLAFQIFTGAADPIVPIGGSGLSALGPMPSQPLLDAFVKDIITRIGSVGQDRTRLAVIFGPLSFDHSDAQVRQLIASAFSIALQNNVAVGFHIDDSMFWATRRDLWGDPANVEWQDWQGTPTTGRRIEWGPRPEKIPPQMCFNSKRVREGVRERAALIGRAIQAGQARLRQQGKEALFAGVIVGWETQIGQDFDTGHALGYHALANRGFSQHHPPPDMDRERERVVQEFIALWCGGLAASGVREDRLYSHTAFLSHRVYDALPEHAVSYSQHNHFAPPSAAFGDGHRPGFSAYPQPGLFAEIHAQVARHGHVAWAASEGTNLQLGSGAGQSGMNMETYLAQMFNHGATLVNLFSWGVGGAANKKMDFRVVTEGDEALAAYRKFLRGEVLVETASASTSYLERLPAKIHRIQQEMPAWIQKTGGQAQAAPLLTRLDAALKANDFTEAERVADLLLQLLPPEQR